jgi:hypothetical protein
MKNTYKVYIAFLVFLTGVIASAIAQQSVKVLFIGNSFTYVHDLPGTFKALANAGGKTVYVDDYTVGGAQFAGTSGLANTAAVYTLMRSQAWDYVVLQDNQGAFAGYQNQVTSANMLANLRLRDSVRAQHPCARVIWFTGWGPKDGVFTGDNTTLELNRIDSNYQYMQNLYPAKKEIMAPFGKAWIASMAGQPSTNLYETDDCHPGMAGQLLNASVLYTTIFKQDPSNINYTAGLSSASASFLRTTGYHTVITPYIYNSHVMPAITPVVTNNAGVLTAPSGYSGYQWFLNNAPISGATSSTFTPTTPGSYCVMATGANGCAQNLSFPVVVTATTGIDENDLSENVILYPNPVSDFSVFEIRDMNWEGGSICIVNVFGQTVLSQPLSSDRFIISKNDFISGVYFYKITDRNGKTASGKINVM